MIRLSEVIKIAQDMLDYCGKKYGTDDTNIKEAPNGLGKFNRFSRELYTAGYAVNGIGYYNTPKDGADYCCIFVDWLFWMASGKNVAETIAKKPQAGGLGGCGAGVGWVWKAYPDNRKGMTPHVGDQIFYKDRNEEWAHTGFVERIDGDDIYTIEGNWGYKVVRRCVRFGEEYNKSDKQVNWQHIGGFATPYYDEEPIPEEPETGYVQIPREEFDKMVENLKAYAEERDALQMKVDELTAKIADLDAHNKALCVEHSELRDAINKLRTFE